MDLDYFAARWRERRHRRAARGRVALLRAERRIATPTSKKLIAACHREGILVYAWLELPHVSEKFWDDHPEWREKTAVLQDAQLDWRKLMNLTNRDCFRAVSAGVAPVDRPLRLGRRQPGRAVFRIARRHRQPIALHPHERRRARAVPRSRRGFDPIELFAARQDAASRRAFLDFRTDLARRIAGRVARRAGIRAARKPHLDLVLTHVDDRFDTGMRDAIGADAARVLPLLEQPQLHLSDRRSGHGLEPWAAALPLDRRARISALTPHREKLAIDLNIVDRYQNVYPTKQQTGTELFQLVHQAVGQFRRAWRSTSKTRCCRPT